MESCLHSRLHSGTKLEIDLRKVKNAVTICQVRNEGLTLAIGVGIEKREWVREIPSLGGYLCVQRKEKTWPSPGFLT